MMRIAINGFGRIGRPTLRRILENHPKLEVVAINDLADKETLLFLLEHDSVYGKFQAPSIKFQINTKLQFYNDQNGFRLKYWDFGYWNIIALSRSGVTQSSGRSILL